MINQDIRIIKGRVTNRYGDSLKDVVVLLERVNNDCSKDVLSSCLTNEYGEYYFYIENINYDYTLKFFYNGLEEVCLEQGR